jgi:hypothetical protein
MGTKSATTKGASKKVKSGAERRKNKYPLQAARTERNKKNQAKARARRLIARKNRALATDNRSKGASAYLNWCLRHLAKVSGVTITEFKKANPNWRTA